LRNRTECTSQQKDNYARRLNAKRRNRILWPKQVEGQDITEKLVHCPHKKKENTGSRVKNGIKNSSWTKKKAWPRKIKNKHDVESLTSIREEPRRSAIRKRAKQHKGKSQEVRAEPKKGKALRIPS